MCPISVVDHVMMTAFVARAISPLPVSVGTIQVSITFALLRHIIHLYRASCSNERYCQPMFVLLKP